MLVKNTGKSQIVVAIQGEKKIQKFTFEPQFDTEVDDIYAKQVKQEKYFKMYVESGELVILKDAESPAVATKVKIKDDSVSATSK